MKDIYGYEKNVKPGGRLASSMFATVQIGGGSDLMQDATIDYQQEIEESTVLGDTHVYWIPGRSRGSLQASQLVGDKGFFREWRDNNCGYIDPVAVTVDGGRCDFEGKGTLKFGGVMIERFGVQITTGRQSVTESITARLAAMDAS